MAERNKNREKAKAEYVTRRSKGEEINLKAFALEMGVNYRTILRWRTEDLWDGDTKEKKRGGQRGNKNSKGKKNAEGSHPGAPIGNTNAEKDGAYSKIRFDMLSEEERRFIDALPVGSREVLEHELRVLQFREHRILERISAYEKMEDEAEGEPRIFLHTMTEIEGAENSSTMRNQDSAFARVQKLQEALYKVQGRIASVAGALRGMDEFMERIALERERLEIMRLRDYGAVDVEEPEGEEFAYDPAELEDVL